jgi:hypothetical protein
MKVRVMKYKVGDKVRVRADLKSGQQWGKDGVNVTPYMEKLAGKIVTLEPSEFPNRYRVHDCMFYWVDEMFEPVNNQKIVITSDGVETLARLYDGNKVVKSASAKCCPDDEFDFKIGAKIAYERLIGEEKPKVEEKPIEKPKFEVGKYYKYDGTHGEGIIKITEVDGSVIYYEIVEGLKYDSPAKSFEIRSPFAMNTTPIDYTEKTEKVESLNQKYQTGDYAQIIACKHDHGFKIGTVVRLTKDNEDYEATDSTGHTWYVTDDELTPVTWKAVDRPVKKGDYVRIVRCGFGFNKVGDILKVHEPHGTGILVLDKHHPRSTGYSVDDYEWCYCKEHFEVVEPLGEKKPEPKTETKPTFKEGDRVRHAKYGDGTVICLAEFGGYGVEFEKKDFLSHNCTPQKLVWGRCGTEGTCHWCDPEEITLITEKPKKDEKPKKQKYNGKVVCVESEHSFWTVGKVYEFKDGIIIDDDGDRRGIMCHFGCFEDWDKFCKDGRSMKFIEVVE